MDIFPKTNKLVVLNKHVGWNFPHYTALFLASKLNEIKLKFDIYPLRPLLGMLSKDRKGSLVTGSDFLNSIAHSLINTIKNTNQKLINVRSRIRPFWVDLFPKNKYPCGHGN